LPAEFRDVVVMADLEGLSYKEIAEMVGCPEGTVMSRLFRGRQRLRKRLTTFAQQAGYITATEAAGSPEVVRLRDQACASCA
jgi:RNA polymerase sigma-70 factor (ECF subfamily)